MGLFKCCTTSIKCNKKRYLSNLWFLMKAFQNNYFRLFLLNTCRPSWNCTAACMASSSFSTLSLQVLFRFSHAEFTWKKDMSTQSNVSANEEEFKMAMAAINYLINTLLYHRFIRFPTGSHELCSLVLNHIELFLQPINLLFKSLQE